LQVLLFDIDGTLVHAAPGRGYRHQVKEAIASIFGTAGRLDEVRFDGKTDVAILREALEPAGIGADEIRARVPEWERVFRALVERLDQEQALFEPTAGAAALLEQLGGDPLFPLALLTGNLESMAWAKLRSAGLAHHFRYRGAYGSDHEDRNELPSIAAARLAEQTGCQLLREQFVIIGDTPRDIAAARGAGMRSIGVATGNYREAELADCGADAVLPDFADAARFIRACRAR
jgi:phosphoglycolate phosphatase-like HAD superfamily hydrolase